MKPKASGKKMPEKAPGISSKNYYLAAVVLAGIGIYIIIDVILAFLRPDLSLLHNAESDYGRGAYFWLMDINFILRGLFSLVLAKLILVNFPKDKLARQFSGVLIVWAVASGLLAFFADNPYGYAKLASGSVHLALAFVAFLAALIAMFVSSRRPISLSPRATVIVRILSVIALLSLLALGHAGFRPASFGGLYERIFLASVLAWEAILAIRFSSNSSA